MTTRSDFVNSVYQAGLAAGLTDAAARVMASQAAHESAYGERAPGNNYFGIKASKDWSGKTQQLTTHEVIGGKRQKIKDAFRAYDSPEEAIADRVSFMASRFPAFNTAATVGDALDALQAGKYGKYYTDSRATYEGSINSINSNYLGGHPVPPNNIPGGSVRPEVSSYQQKLARRGFDPGPIDGVRGPRTTAAVKAFQQANGLVVDGIVGPKTLAALGNDGPRAQQQMPPTKPESLLDFSGMPPRPSRSWRTYPDPVTAAETRAEQRGTTSFRPLPTPPPLRPPQTSSIAPIPRTFPMAQGGPVVPVPRPRPVNAAPLVKPPGGGFDLGAMLGGLGGNLQAGLNSTGQALGTAANNVVEGTRTATQNATDLLKNEMLGTVKGRTVMFNAMLGLPPPGSHDPNRYGKTQAERQENARRRQAMMDGVPYQAPAVRTQLSVKPPILPPPQQQTGIQRQQAQQAEFARRGLDQFGMII